MSEPECPNCRLTLLPGFLLDRGDHNNMGQTHWVAGLPERSFWFGLKVRGKERVPVMTHRCPRCGLLQSYARTE